MGTEAGAASCPLVSKEQNTDSGRAGKAHFLGGGVDLLLEAGAGWVGVRDSEHPFCWAQQVKKTSRAPCHGPQQKHRITPRLFPNAFWAPSESWVTGARKGLGTHL